MAIVLSLLIVGWLVAFALGNQAGFSNQPTEEKPAPAQAVSAKTASVQAATDYRKPASIA